MLKNFIMSGYMYLLFSVLWAFASGLDIGSGHPVLGLFVGLVGVLNLYAFLKETKNA